MEITLLILIHMIYVGKLLDCMGEDRADIFLTSGMLTLLCWQCNTTWGIVTLCYSVIIFLILALKK